MPDPQPNQPNKVTITSTRNGIEIDIEVNDPSGPPLSAEQRKSLEDLKRKHRELRDARKQRQELPVQPPEPPADDKPAA